MIFSHHSRLSHHNNQYQEPSILGFSGSEVLQFLSEEDLFLFEEVGAFFWHDTAW